MAEEPRRIARSPVRVELEDESRAGGVEDLRDVRYAAAEEDGPRRVLVYLRSVQVEEHLQEIASDAPERKMRRQFRGAKISTEKKK